MADTEKFRLVDKDRLNAQCTGPDGNPHEAIWVILGKTVNGTSRENTCPRCGLRYVSFIS